MDARRWLREHDAIVSDLAGIKCEYERRRVLSACPGIGSKTASWLLRNLGLANSLAIIDVHVFRALQKTKRLTNTASLPKDYERAEGAFLEWCNELEAPAAAFDLFLWEWERGSLLNG